MIEYEKLQRRFLQRYEQTQRRLREQQERIDAQLERIRRMTTPSLPAVSNLPDFRIIAAGTFTNLLWSIFMLQWSSIMWAAVIGRE